LHLAQRPRFAAQESVRSTPAEPALQCGGGERATTKPPDSRWDECGWPHPRPIRTIDLALRTGEQTLVRCAQSTLSILGANTPQGEHVSRGTTHTAKYMYEIQPSTPVVAGIACPCPVPRETLRVQPVFNTIDSYTRELLHSPGTTRGLHTPSATRLVHDPARA
jgi:hypothetical protein